MWEEQFFQEAFDGHATIEYYEDVFLPYKQERWNIGGEQIYPTHDIFLEMDQVIFKSSETTLKTFDKLWQEKDFTDVTLAACDGKQIKAHRVILASASKFFRNLLGGSCHENPLIYF